MALSVVLLLLEVRPIKAIVIWLASTGLGGLAAVLISGIRASGSPAPVGH
jgi:hypothetical protein